MEANVWAPLGMGSTTFHPDRRPEMMERMVACYERTAEFGLAPCE